MRYIDRKLTFGILLAIATQQSLTPVPATASVSMSDTVLHVICWGVLSFALWMAFPHWPQKAQLLGLLFAYSIAIEVGQLFVVGRQTSFLDMVANGFGCLLIYLTLHSVERRVGQASRDRTPNTSR